MTKITQATEILKQTTGIDSNTDPEMLQMAEDFRAAQMIYDARIAANFTQKQLAEAVGTTQSVISQLEDADYDGHSLSMLRRVAKALHRRIEIRMVPEEANQITSLSKRFKLGCSCTVFLYAPKFSRSS